ncbi:hypothetical protein M7I_1209 [Glarea lozoyensis 74030]|uniref:Uncharacterized protein n=1 Tax=Glarea lozoyensis (strain ATCC 74030 / MF5533) TaxID=1104152 RepID=H0EFD6_GLAL7|nr:hypothetical protein M7I_1209 [Glarea lozoyensis 74030]
MESELSNLCLLQFLYSELINVELFKCTTIQPQEITSRTQQSQKCLFHKTSATISNHLFLTQTEVRGFK